MARKIGINFNAYRTLPDERQIELCAELGFEAMFSGAFDLERHRSIDELMQKHGIAHEFIHSAFNKINDMWLPTEDGEWMDAELRRAVDNASILGVPAVVVHLSSGNNPPSITDLGRARYTALVEYAAEKNVIIAFENLRKLANVAWAMEEFAKCENVRFCWDCGHESCYTPKIQFMPLFGDRLYCTHLHDNRGTFCDDDHMLPFDGKVDFNRVARQIRESGFSGTIMLEVAYNPFFYPNLSAEEYLARAAETAKRIRDMVDEGCSL